MVLVSRNKEWLEAAVRRLDDGPPVTILEADLSKAHERERVAATIGDVDVLVNNAGASPGGGLADITMERWQAGLPFDRRIDAAEIGRTAAFLASPACGYVAGTVLDMDGGGMLRGRSPRASGRIATRGMTLQR